MNYMIKYISIHQRPNYLKSKSEIQTHTTSQRCTCLFLFSVNRFHALSKKKSNTHQLSIQHLIHTYITYLERERKQALRRSTYHIHIVETIITDVFLSCQQRSKTYWFLLLVSKVNSDPQVR